MKKFAKYLLVLCVMIPCALIFTSCKKTAQATSVMTMSVNPEVSFVLDSKNKVLSVNYSNEDAGNLYADINFVGKDVDSTIQIFIERAAISGHVDLNGDEVTIEISGMDQKKVDDLKNKAKTKVEEVFKTFGAEVEVKVSNLAVQAQHNALVAKAEILAPEKDTYELQAMSDKELLELINTKQTELKDLTYEQIQQLQDDFSVAKNSLMKTIDSVRAMIKSTRDYIENLEEKYKDSIPESIKEQIDEAKAKIDGYQKELDAKIDEFLAEKSQEIDKLKAKYEEAKEKADLEFKSQVEQSKKDVVAHLEISKNNGTITQEQYDYWVNIINGQKAA